MNDQSRPNSQIQVGVLGCGSMGSGLAVLFAQHGSPVSIFDKDQKMVSSIISRAQKDPDVPPDLLHATPTLRDFVSSFRPHHPRIIMLSLPHGPTIDKVLEDLVPMLTTGDVILDGANEWWEETERRQKWIKEKRGVHLIGCGVSGGYQSARRGPSMSPGGEREAYALVEPLLAKWAAKTTQGKPCVTYIGPGGSGHFVKMLHNGIEQGMLSIMCEAHALLHRSLSLSNAEIASIFESWNSKGELKSTYLVRIGAEVLRFAKGDGAQNTQGIVDDIDDKVTQDVDNGEGTGVWTMKAFAGRHVAAPTLAAAHNLRIVSANKAERVDVVRNMKIPRPSEIDSTACDKDAFVEMLRKAVYGAFLASFVQGCNVIARASREQGWNVSLADCIQIWRAGCIIESEYISDLLQPYYTSNPSSPNALLSPKIGSSLAGTYQALKGTVKLSVESDAVIPALAASLEYVKSVGGDSLPTSFEETELDYFGHHNYDLKWEKKGAPEKGMHHTEWKKA